MSSTRQIAETANVYITQARERIRAMRDEFKSRGKVACHQACGGLLKELDLFQLKLNRVARGDSHAADQVAEVDPPKEDDASGNR